MEWQAAEFQKRTGIKCEFIAEAEGAVADPELTTALFRIFQEALTNVGRHANATRVRVSLKEQARKVLLEIRDNGKGITEEHISSPMSLGLMGIRERAHSWGGEVQIKGVQGKGTNITVSIPLKRGETR